MNLVDRLGAIKDLRGAFSEAGYNIPNIKKECERIIDENDIAMVEALEAAAISYDSKVTAEKNKVKGIRNMKAALEPEAPELTDAQIKNLFKYLLRNL